MRPYAGGPGGRRSPFWLADSIGAFGMLVVVVVALAMVAITERTVLTGAVPGAVTPPSPIVVTTSARPSARPDPRVPRATRAAQPLPPDINVLDAQVRRFTIAEREASAERIFGKSPGALPIVSTTRLTASHRWGFGTTVIPAPTDRTALPQAALFLANWTGSHWRISLTGSSDFRAMLHRAPDSLVPPAERATLAQLGVGPSEGLMLPWKVADFWQMPAVADIAAFRGGDARVLAAGDGRLYHFCGSMIMIVHNGGPATEYYGLTQPTAVPDGSPVKTGDYLGQVGASLPCGGGTDQAEVIFGLTGAGGGVPLGGTQIGGWTFREKDGFGWAERGVLKISAGGELANFGPPFQFPDTPQTPSPSPSSTPPGVKLPALHGPNTVSIPTPTGSDRRSTGATP